MAIIRTLVVLAMGSLAKAASLSSDSVPATYGCLSPQDLLGLASVDIDNAISSVPSVPVKSGPGLISGIPGLNCGVPDLLSGLPGLISGVPGLISGVPDLISSVPDLLSGLPGLISGVPGLFEALSGVVNSIPGLFDSVLLTNLTG